MGAARDTATCVSRDGAGRLSRVSDGMWDVDGQVRSPGRQAGTASLATSPRAYRIWKTKTGGLTVQQAGELPADLLCSHQRTRRDGVGFAVCRESCWRLMDVLRPNDQGQFSIGDWRYDCTPWSTTWGPRPASVLPPRTLFVPEAATK